MFQAANVVTLDVLAAVCRKDHEDRRRRQAEGQVKAEAEAATEVTRRTEAGMTIHAIV
jgi:hypothetical protein